MGSFTAEFANVLKSQYSVFSNQDSSPLKTEHLQLKTDIITAKQNKRHLMDFIIQIIFILVIVVATNYIQREDDNNTRFLFDRFVMLSNLPIFLIGVLAIFMTDSFFAASGITPGSEAFPFTNTLALGILLQITAVWGIACSFISVRDSLAKLIPINPASTVHTLALVMAGWLMGMTLIQLTQFQLADLVEILGTISLTDFVIQQAAFVAVALLGVGISIRRNFAQTQQRLGLEPLTLNQLLEGVLWILFLLLIQTVAGWLWEAINPDQVALVEEINTNLQGNLDTVWEWFALAVAAGIGEEILFRGAVQPIFGNVFTSIIFAIAHVQYGLFTPATVALFIISMLFGVIRSRHNTTMAIYVHVGYDLVLGLVTYFAIGVV